MFNVLIACYSNWDSCAELPYILKMAGCNVTVYCSKSSWLLSNSYHDKWILSEKDEKKYCTNLENLYKKNNYDWVVLTDDNVIELMNKNLNDQSLFSKIMPITKIQNRLLLSSKMGLSKFCVANSIDTPNFSVYNNQFDLINIKNNLTFPIVNKNDFGNAGINMIVSHSFEEFQINLSKIQENNNTLIQEYLNGEHIHIEALFYQGYLVSYISASPISNIGNIFSPITRKNYFYDENLNSILSKMGSVIGLNGFTNIHYIKYRDIYYLIEVDPRSNSWMAHSRFIVSNDFISGVKRIVSGEYINTLQSVDFKYKTIEVAYFIRDIHRIISKNKWFEIHRWLFNINGYWKYIPLYDLKLFYRVIISLIKIFLVNIKLKLFK